MPVTRETLLARRDQIQANVAEARQKLRDLEAAIQQGVGALMLLEELLAIPQPEPDVETA